MSLQRSTTQARSEFSLHLVDPMKPLLTAYSWLALVVQAFNVYGYCLRGIVLTCSVQT